MKLTPGGKTFANTACPQITLLHSTSSYYDFDEMLLELNSCLYQLIYGTIGFVKCHFAYCCRTY